MFVLKTYLGEQTSEAKQKMNCSNQLLQLLIVTYHLLDDHQKQFNYIIWIGLRYDSIIDQIFGFALYLL